MGKTYQYRFPLYVRVDAESEKEARKLAREIARGLLVHTEGPVTRLAIAATRCMGQ